MILLLLTLFQLHADPYVGQDFSGIWPGFNSYSPIVLNYPEGPKAFNFDSELPGGIENVALDPEYKIDNQSIFVMKYQDSFTFVHELFHRFQKDRFEFAREASYPDLYNPKNQALMQIEEEILLKYARSPSNEIRDDYLLIRQFRMSKLDKASIHFEDKEERLEGLANYVAMKVTQNNKPIVTMLEGLVKDRNVIDKSLKWRFYATGALLGEMLDKENPDWKEGVAHSSLFGLLEVKKDEGRLNALLANYRYSEKVKQMSLQLEKIQTGISRLRKDFETSSGQEIFLRFASSPSSGGTVQKILALSQNEKVALKESGRTECLEWTLETNQIPFIFNTKEGLILKFNGFLEMDGKEVDLNTIKSPVAFKKIAWNDQQSRFRSKKEGILIPHGKSFEISFQEEN